MGLYTVYFQKSDGELLTYNNHVYIQERFFERCNTDYINIIGTDYINIIGTYYF